MKIVGKIKREGNKIIIEPSGLAVFKYDPDKEYLIDFSPSTNKRTLQQNKLMWQLLNEIAMAEDGNLANVNYLYCQMLEMAGAKYAIIAIKPEAYQEFRMQYRHTVIKGKNKDYLIVQVFYGSSTMSVSEMNKLIDTIIDYAYKIGVESVKAYEQMLEQNR